MTNKERQQNIDNKYENGTAKRGTADWCAMCKHRLPKGGCRIKKDKVTQECLCATAYNKLWRNKHD